MDTELHQVDMEYLQTAMEPLHVPAEGYSTFSMEAKKKKRRKGKKREKMAVMAVTVEDINISSHLLDMMPHLQAMVHHLPAMMNHLPTMMRHLPAMVVPVETEDSSSYLVGKKKRKKREKEMMVTKMEEIYVTVTVFPLLDMVLQVTILYQLIMLLHQVIQLLLQHTVLQLPHIQTLHQLIPNLPLLTPTHLQDTLSPQSHLAPAPRCMKHNKCPVLRRNAL